MQFYLKHKSFLYDGFIAIGLFGLALWLRQADLTHFVTADEHNWVYRSGLFLSALTQQDWIGTSLWYTPAVTTTWLGSGSLALFYQLNQADINQPLAQWAASFSRNKINLDVLHALRWSTVLFSSVMVVIVYGLARKLWSRPLALLGTLLLATEPHLLAVSRIIGHDVYITFLTISSLLALLYAKRLISQSTRRYYLWLALSGVFAGLAILSKAPALILLPFVVLLALVDGWYHKNHRQRWLWGGLVWLGVSGLTFVIIWPAAWVSPWEQVWYVISTAFFSSTGAEDADIQPYWTIPDLGNYYYLVNGAYKVSPFIFIGTILAAIGATYKAGIHPHSMKSYAGEQRFTYRSKEESPIQNLKSKIQNRLVQLNNNELVWLSIFSVLFTVMMTFGAKKSPRYILPVFPALAFVAAWGWLNLAQFPLIAKHTRLHRYWNRSTMVVLGSTAILLTLNYAPYYFTYFNPLLGGASTAVKVVRIGWGEGLDELGRWLNSQPDRAVSRVGARYTVALYPFYQGSISSPISAELDYVAFYIKQSQSGYPSPEILAYFEQQPLLHHIELNGLEYTQVYQGPAMVPIDPTGSNKLPVAYRLHTIYAPLGQTLTVDLLWHLDNVKERATLQLQSIDGTITLTNQAPIQQLTPQVWVSQHQFEIPPDTPRDTLALIADDHWIGQLKARQLTLPPDFKPLSAGFAGQLKLAGVRQSIENNQLNLDLAWQGWPQANNDFTVFVQVLDEEGQRIAGVDVSPETGFTTLDRKEVMLTHYNIPLPDNLQTNTYSLLIGLYYFAGDELINVGAVTLESDFIQ